MTIRDRLERARTARSRATVVRRWTLRLLLVLLGLTATSALGRTAPTAARAPVVHPATDWPGLVGTDAAPGPDPLPPAPVAPTPTQAGAAVPTPTPVPMPVCAQTAALTGNEPPVFVLAGTSPLPTLPVPTLPAPVGSLLGGTVGGVQTLVGGGVGGAVTTLGGVVGSLGGGSVSPAGTAPSTGGLSLALPPLLTPSSPGPSNSPSTVLPVPAPPAGSTGTPAATPSAPSTAPSSSLPAPAIAAPAVPAPAGTAPPGPETTGGECSFDTIQVLSSGTPMESATQASAVADALALLGTPYRWGGESRSGFDCSGLVQFAYGEARYRLPRVAQDQFDAGPAVAPGTPVVPGDLVFFGSGPSQVTHVGMFVGQGSMVDAPHPGATVRLDKIAGFGPVVGVTAPAGTQVA